MWLLDDVIAAVASAPGAGCRGIVRVAGPGVRSLVEGMIGPRANNPAGEPFATRATRLDTKLNVQGLSTPLPAALFVWPDSRSYTGQPSVEIHTIGSPPILNAIVEDLVRRGARVARPGEFTLRAFLSGKIDLVQAEAVLGVIDADSTTQLQQALMQLAGGISSKIRELREKLLIDLADLEAGLDFVEEDIEFVDRAAMTARLEQAVDWLEKLEEHAKSRGQTTGRQTVVLAGLPNAGKSTLFNALATRDAAIVSSVAGTTRDWLTTTIDLDGYEVELVDTAGAESATDEISADAQAARTERLQQADLVIWCAAADLTIEEIRQETDVRNEVFSASKLCIGVVTKIDRGASLAVGVLNVSAVTGEGLGELKSVVKRSLQELAGDDGELLTSTLARCSESLSRAREALARAADFSRSHRGEELVASELRRGLEALGEIAGVVYTDDLLDRIFSRFCIGK
jgi:tRNA modification GTPase